MKTIRSIFYCWFLLSLTACQSAFLTNLTTSKGERLFWDDFTNPSEHWPVYSTNEGAFAYADGAYVISVIVPSYQLWALSGHAYRDVQIEADVSRLAGPEVNLFGVICRAIDEANFYFFVISSDGYYTIGKVEDNGTALLGQEMMAYNAVILPGEGLNHLRFDCIGSTLSGYINGKMVALTEDVSFRGGDSGLIAGSFAQGGVQIRFDNFVVYKP